MKKRINYLGIKHNKNDSVHNITKWCWIKSGAYINGQSLPAGE
jgi:hypothetical protein